MKHSLSQPVGIPEGDKRFNMPDLDCGIRVERCLTCNESYVIQDPLGIFKEESHWVIYNVYFGFSDAVYFLENKPSQIEVETIRKASAITQQGVDKLRSDIEEKNSLYELFLDIHTKESSDPFYNEEEFYGYFEPAFMFFMKFWESVNTVMQEARTSNNDEKFNEKHWEVNHLLDEMKGSSGLRELLYDEGLTKPGEINPYTKSFSHNGKRYILQNNGNMNPNRIQEIKDMWRIDRVKMTLYWDNYHRERITKETKKYREEYGEDPPEDYFDLTF